MRITTGASPISSRKQIALEDSSTNGAVSPACQSCAHGCPSSLAYSDIMAALPVIAIANVAPKPPIRNAARARLPGVRSQRSAWCRKPRKIAVKAAPASSEAV